MSMGVVALKIKGGCKLSARMSNEIKETTQDNFQGNLTTGLMSRALVNHGAIH